jgi:hypothetical protein
MATTLDNIQYNPQTVGVVAKGCASKLGFQLLKNKIKGKDCECETIDLKYLLRAQKEIMCYNAPGSISNEGVLNQSTLGFLEDNYGWISISITSSNGQLNASVVTTKTDVFSMVDALITTYINTTSYVATAYADGNDTTVFNIIAPIGVFCGVTYTITIRAKDALHPNIVMTGTFLGGQCVVTEDDNCITVNDANQIIENINEICGGLCSGCNGFFTDSEPIE